VLEDRYPVGVPVSRSGGISRWIALTVISRPGFDTRSSIPDPTLGLSGTIVIMLALATSHYVTLKLSVGVTRQPHLLEIYGLCTQGLRPGRACGESIGKIS